MEKRKVLFHENEKFLFSAEISLPGNFYNPPKTIRFQGKLWKYTGSGASANFYHAVEAYEVESSPHLQPVTRETIEELCRRKANIIVIRSDGHAMNKTCNAGTEYDSDWRWLIDLSTFPRDHANQRGDQ